MCRWIVPAVFTALVVLCMGANYRTQNFIVSAASPQLAKEVGDLAEVYRHDLALEWLGKELPPWERPCPIQVTTAPEMGAGGQTSFMFQGNRPFGWEMQIYGSRERVLDSVLPHEVTHTIFATHFGRPLPRWADEGACTTVENASERHKHERLLIKFLTTNQGIAFNRMFAMKEYPDNILPLYSQGYALARFLIQQGGKQKFVQYIGEGMDRGQDRNAWTVATTKYYGYDSLGELQTKWLEWVRIGTPEPVTQELVRIDTTTGQSLASANGPAGGVPVAPATVNELMPATPSQAFAPGTTGNTIARAAGEGWYEQTRDDVRLGKAPPREEMTADGNPFRQAGLNGAGPQNIPAPPVDSTAAMNVGGVTLPPVPLPPAAGDTRANPFRSSATNDRQILLEWRRDDEKRDWAKLEGTEALPEAVVAKVGRPSLAPSLAVLPLVWLYPVAGRLRKAVPHRTTRLAFALASP